MDRIGYTEKGLFLEIFKYFEILFELLIIENHQPFFSGAMFLFLPFPSNLEVVVLHIQLCSKVFIPVPNSGICESFFFFFEKRVYSRLGDKGM